MKAPRFSNYLLAIIVFILPGCTHQKPWEEEGNALINEADRLEQQHLLLDARIDSLWDVTTESLAAAIPADFPPTDREIFLNSRNADHIRMFMSFKDLSPETQSLVDAAGKYDAMLASDIKDLQLQKEDFEKRKNQFLRKVDEQSKEASLLYAELFRRTAAGHSN